MTPAARLAASIEILDAWLARPEPVDGLLRNWGHAHRFAGSKDRAAIGDRVYAVLRAKSLLAARTGEESGRALVLASLAGLDGLSVPEIDTLLTSGGPHAPPPLSEAERGHLAKAPTDLPPWIAGSYPQWLHDDLKRMFGAALAREAQAWLDRAPLDLRVNTLKVTREEAQAELSAHGFDAQSTPISPIGLRLSGGAALAASAPYRDGLVEIQDEGSQLSVLVAGARPGMTVFEIGAGAGGKSLALAAAMKNQGRLIAADIDAPRLERLGPRAARAGASIIETRVVKDGTSLDDVAGACDLVFIDAPCSGSGTWRREPENKWRLTPAILAERIATQRALLTDAARCVRPGGRLVYVTCSLLPQENEDRVSEFLVENRQFVPEENGMGLAAAAHLPMTAGRMQLSPGQTQTDGFFVAVLTRASDAEGLTGRRQE